MYKNSVHTSHTTNYFPIIKNLLLVMYGKLMADWSLSHVKHINTQTR
jgi:hypothetical protein